MKIILFLNLFFFFSFKFYSSFLLQNEIYFLNLLYNSTSGLNWLWKNEVLYGLKWNFTKDKITNQYIHNPCNDNNQIWQGIICSSSIFLCQTISCSIISINLYSYNLNGTLPDYFNNINQLTYLDLSYNLLNHKLPSSISTLSKLNTLILSSNNLNSSIPSSYGSLTLLSTMNLNLNKLTNTIPYTFGNLTLLTHLDLSSNLLTGNIPESIGSLTNLLDLYLYTNKLNSTIPKSIGSLNLLQRLYLYSNSLTGSIPSTIGSLTNLYSLSLNNNYLSYSIPETIGSLTNLQIMYLYYNYLTGPLPLSIGSLSKLVVIYLNNNYLSQSIPSTIGSLNELIFLLINENYLTGSIPDSIGSLLKLQRLYLNGNKINGSIPETIGSLTNLGSLYLYYNEMSGSIPSSIGLLSKIKILYLYSNYFTDSIPSTIGLLSQVQQIYFNINLLTGSIPFTIGNLTTLQGLYLDSNLMSCNLPSTIGLLSQIVDISLDDNYFSNTIPESICLLSSLQSLSLFTNYINGSIPKNIGFLNNLLLIDFNSNQMTGIIPLSIGNLTLLQEFSIYNNYFTGNIPTEIGLLIRVEQLLLNNNILTGIIPSTLNLLKKVQTIHLYNNKLSGSITLQIELITSIQQLFLQNNKLTGSINYLVMKNLIKHNSTIFNLDLSDNQLTGTIPDNLFNFQFIQSISLSLNCFHGKLPNSICNAKSIEVLSLNGLNGAKSCKTTYQIPFTKVLIVETLDGSIPECIWSLSNLNTLNLAGNGLHGTISQLTSKLDNLTDVILSNNYLTGTIPSSLQKKSLSILDLSHNKLTGELNNINNNYDNINNNNNSNNNNNNNNNNNISKNNKNKSLKLEVNRLSGKLPHNLKQYSTLEILSGNIFSCDNIPSNDKNSEWYNCSSSEFDHSMSAMSVIIGIIIIIIILYFIQLKWNISNKFVDFFSCMIDYYYYFINITKLQNEIQLLSLQSTNSLKILINFGYIISNLIKYLFYLIIITLIFSIPIYLLKVINVENISESDTSSNSNYVTFTHQYRWFGTVAFLSGNLPAIFFLILCLISMITFSTIFYLIYLAYNLLKKLSKNNEERNENEVENENENKNDTIILSKNYWSIIPFLLIFINISIVGTINGIYIWSTLINLSKDIRLLIQFSISLFNFLWGVFIPTLLPIKMKESRTGIWFFTLLHVLNGVLIPCIVTALTSPSCYQSLLIQPEYISSSYTYLSCIIYLFLPSQIVCVASIPVTTEPLKIIPPFTYSYQCGSTLLVAYIPVYMYTITIQIIFQFLRLLLPFQTKYTDYPSYIQQFLPGIGWPEYWTDEQIIKLIQYKKEQQEEEKYEREEENNNNNYNYNNDNSNNNNQEISPLQKSLLDKDDFKREEYITNSNLSLDSTPRLITKTDVKILSPFLIKPDRILSGIVNNLLLFMSFGLCSPVLGCYIIFSIIITLILWLLLIGRYIIIRILDKNQQHHNRYNSNNSNKNVIELIQNQEQDQEQNQDNYRSSTFLNRSYALIILGECLKDVIDHFLVCKWLILLTSCLFITLLCWDMVGDKVGWLKAIWVPISGIFMLFIVKLYEKFLLKYYKGNEVQLNQDDLEQHYS